MLAVVRLLVFDWALLTCGLIVVDVDSLQLKVGVTMVGTGGVNAMLVWDNLPELKNRQNNIEIL